MKFSAMLDYSIFKEQINMDKKNLIINQVIKDIPFSGVSNNTLLTACKKLNILEGKLLFTEGIQDVIFEFESNITDQIIIEIDFLNENFYKMKLREKIQHIIKRRLFHYSELLNYKELLRRLYAFYLSAYNIPFFTKTLYYIVDSTWKMSLDHSSDFNYYTKRISLSLIFINTILYFIEDYSLNHEDTIKFLSRRIDGTISFSKIVNRLKSLNKYNSLFKVNFNE